MKKIIVNIICYLISALIFATGLFVFLYPLINRSLIDNNAEENLQIFRNVKSVYSANKKAHTDTDENNPDDNSQSTENNFQNEKKDFDSLLQDMKKYNLKIYEEGQKNLKDAWSYEQSAFDLYSYGIYNGVIGEIRIPAMDCNLPIYMGATMGNMAKGVAQLGETSAPIGGKNTNCVIAGHRGASGGKFFLDIMNLKIGDKVYIDNLWDSLTYQVTKIEVIKPTENEKIFIQKGKDMVTLTTCHPYPNNSHRYIVYCQRTKNDKTEAVEKDIEKLETDINLTEETFATSPEIEARDNSTTYMKVEKIAYITIPVMLILLFIILTFVGKKQNKKKNKLK